MLSQAISSADDVVILGRAILVSIGLEFFHDGIVGLLRVQWILDRTLDRLVMFRERAVGYRPNGHEQTSHALRIHDERPHVVFGLRVRLEVGYIVADPFLCRFVPPNLLPRRIPGLSVEVARRAVVQHTAVSRPGKRPIWIDAEAGGIFRATASHHVAGFGEGA